MTLPHVHATHPALVAWLKHAEGHLRHVIGMIDGQQRCLDIARQRAAVESAVTFAKRALIHDHIDHCLVHGTGGTLDKVKAITKLV